MDLDTIIENYVAVWNESDPQRRRERIRSVWAEDGVTCYRLLEARGYEAIEGRVVGSWDKWLRDGKYTFRPARSAHHHDIIKFDFVMVTVPEGQVEARGLSFLLLDSNGSIRFDYQFNPTANEARSFVDLYLAVLNEPLDDRRSQLLSELWASDAIYVGENFVKYGHSEIAAKAAELNEATRKKDCLFKTAGASHAHHNFVRFTWKVEKQLGGDVITAGSDLVILDEQGRIRRDYQFDEPMC